MSRTRLFWIIASLLTIAAAVVFFPIEAFEKGGIYYALLMGVLVGASLSSIAVRNALKVVISAMAKKESKPISTPISKA